MKPATRLGRKLRMLRTQEKLTQAAMAERLGISASYLNLIENDRRPMPATLLIALAHSFHLDLKTLDAGESTRLIADLNEVFGDPLFEEQPVPRKDLEDLVSESPEVARAILRLHHAFTSARDSAQSLAAEALDRQDLTGLDRAGLSSEQVSDFIQQHNNFFPDLEAAAERVARMMGPGRENLFGSLSDYLQKSHGVRVRTIRVSDTRGAVRRFDPERRELILSEALRRGSRNFQLAHQIGLLDCPDALEGHTRDPRFTSEESRALCRVALANYFAGALLMPYHDFIRAAEGERYDIDLLGHRFRASFEQVCHRLTSLQRDGARGIPFHMVRIDIAGNISKKFSASGIRLPRFGGLCPLWSVHAAFLQPGQIRTQLSRLPDGTTFFSVARTVRKHRGGFHAPEVLYAIGLGCDVESALRMVYSDGVDLGSAAAALPVGITCRLCERMECQARAFPSLQRPLRVSPNVRGISFYAPVSEE